MSLSNQRRLVAPQEVTFDISTAEQVPTAEMQVGIQQAELTQEQITEGVFVQPEETVAPQEVMFDISTAEQVPTNHKCRLAFKKQN